MADRRSCTLNPPADNGVALLIELRVRWVNSEARSPETENSEIRIKSQTRKLEYDKNHGPSIAAPSGSDFGLRSYQIGSGRAGIHTRLKKFYEAFSSVL
jgi:hypothetical protein